MLPIRPRGQYGCPLSSVIFEVGLMILIYLTLCLPSGCQIDNANDHHHKAATLQANFLQQNRHRYGHQLSSSQLKPIYVNPNPSPVSDYQYRPHHRHHHNAPANDLQGGLPSEKRLAHDQAGHRRESRDSHSNGLVQSSNIGKDEESQIADWPFFKSLQMARHRGPPDSVSTATLSAVEQNHRNRVRNSVTSSSQAANTQTNPTRDESRMAKLIDNNGPTNGDSTSTTTTTTEPSASSDEPGQMVGGSQVRQDAAMAPDATGTTERIEMSAPIEGSIVREQGDTTQTAISAASTSSQWSTYSTTELPTSTSTPPLVVMMNDRLDPLFATNFHGSIQQAVDRIVKMTSKSVPSATLDSTSPQPVAINENVKSSLSLNVLLKNFGVHNLTNLDQISLRSTLRNDTSAIKRDNVLLPSDQKIEITGVRNSIQPLKNLKGEQGNQDVGDEDQTAECKIEYTMKHVNISLFNGDRGDYTCDYIIDRNIPATTKPYASKPIGDPAKVCKLKLTSKFFTNQPLEINGIGDKDDSSGCNGTHLAIGKLRFCYLRESDEVSRTLNRIFDFPTETDSFDVKMVHKQPSDERQRETVIHLEIKPLSGDEFCEPAKVADGGAAPPEPLIEARKNESLVTMPKLEPLVEYDITERPETTASGMMDGAPSTTTRPHPPAISPPIVTNTIGVNALQQSTNQTSSTNATASSESDMYPIAREPPIRSSTTKIPSIGPREVQNAPIGITVIQPSGPKRKFVIKLPNEKQLHPLNNRFKVSQTFDVTSTPRRAQVVNSAIGLDGVAANASVRNVPIKPVLPKPIEKLCDGADHNKILGQLSSPEYPQYYPANVNCAFRIKAASSAYCYLMLHFRDFDLINNEMLESAGATGDNCPDDYLLIGETKYCNRYAMIGHKMKLDFLPSTSGKDDSPSIAISFKSDHMRSGRGFLVKYQQIMCNSSQADQQQLIDSTALGQQQPANQRVLTSTTLIGDLVEQIPKEHTVAPPMQQPDFSLALKTMAPMTQVVGDADRGSPGATVVERTKALPAPANEINPSLPNHFNEKSMVQKQQGLASNKRSRSYNATSGSSMMSTSASTVSSSSLTAPIRPRSGNSLFDYSHSTNGLLSAESGPDCNQVNGEMNFHIKSPNFPEPYANNLHCLFYVRRNSSQVCYIELTFVKFELEADADCRFDYMEINNVRLCGSLKELAHKTTRIYLFNEPLKVITFKSDESGSSSGFLIKANQLECSPDGTIIRQGRAFEAAQSGLQQQPASVLTASQVAHSEIRTQHLSQKNHNPARVSNRNQSRMFDYDNVLGGGQQWPVPRLKSALTSQLTTLSPAIGGPPLALAAGPSAHQITVPSQRLNVDDSRWRACDASFHGKQATIRSPMWPDSYSNDESLDMCRYTIIRDTSSRNKICQLELRFVNLKLAANDCFDIDGYEVLCGFSTRNMVKYYPFDRQSQLTITFFTGASLALKVAAARRKSLVSDILPTRTPLRFMIIAKQHECIDGFLAPQVDLQIGYNQTNLLYSMPLYTHKVNRTADTQGSNGERQSIGNDLPSLLVSARQTMSSAAPSSPLIRYDFATLSNGNSLKSNADRTKSAEPKLMYSLTGATIPAQQLPGAGNDTTTSSSRPSPLHDGGYGRDMGSGICLDGSIVRSDDRLFSANYPLSYNNNSHCILTIARRSDEICHLELEFVDLDLEPYSSICNEDYLQINFGERYCTMEQLESRLGPRRQLLLPLDRGSDFKVTVLFHSGRLTTSRRGFLIHHRQVECSTTPATTSTAVSAFMVGSTRKQVRFGEPESKLIDKVPLVSRQPNFGPNLQDNPTSPCLVQFNRYNGILRSSGLLARMTSLECEVQFKLLPGYCQLQLTFGEFNLAPRDSYYCLQEYLELSGVRYCGDELKNANRTLLMSDPNQRIASLRFRNLNINSSNEFRTIFKQIECQPEPLKPIGTSNSTSATTATRPDGVDKLSAVMSLGHSPSHHQTPQTLVSAFPTAASRVEQNEQVKFREIVIREELFILKSNDFVDYDSKSLSDVGTYDANMFLLYRIKKVHPEVCKIQLYFSAFDLETSAGCKRDFLDVNNVDRLCGKLVKPFETRRYDWTNERDFLISFVSDNQVQHEGFVLTGLQSKCTERQEPAGYNEEPRQQADNSTGSQQTHHTKQTTGQEKSLPTKTKSNPLKQVDEHQSHEKAAMYAAFMIAYADESPSCSKFLYEPKFELSSPNWPKKYNPNTVCHYIIHKAQPNICSVSFNVVSMILGTYEMDDMSSCKTNRDYLEIDEQLLCGFISKPHLITVQFKWRQYVTVKFNSLAASNGFGFFIEVRQNECSGEEGNNMASNNSSTVATTMASSPLGGSISDTEARGPSLEDSPKKETESSSSHQDEVASCNKLSTDELTYIESENFPDHYNHNQDCLYALRRVNSSICAIDIIFNHFELEEQSSASGLCEKDYLEIDYSRLCGSYPAKHRMRFNYFNEELDKLIKFHTDAASSQIGFSLTIKQVSDCSGSKSQEQHQTKLESDELITYLPDSSTTGVNLSAANSVGQNHEFIEPELIDKASNSTSGRLNSNEQQEDPRQPVTTLCQFIYHKERQYLVSPGYNEERHHYDPNLDCLYKIVAKGYEFCSLKLSVIDLDLENSNDCHNDYLLIDNQRYCGSSHHSRQQSANGAGQVQFEVQFADTLPREIHLLLHTNAHINNGTGFKLLYEQQLCSQESNEQNFHLQNSDSRITHPASSTSSADRLARRLTFGQLSYPKNYISSGTVSTGVSQERSRSPSTSVDTSSGDARNHQRNLWNEKRPQLLVQAVGSGERQRSIRTSADNLQGEKSRLEDLEWQYDDLTLRKKILVAKSTPIEAH